MVFKDADGTIKRAPLALEVASDFAFDTVPLAELGRMASELGYKVKPGMEALVGCYLDAKLDEASDEAKSEYERRQAKAGQ